jgi:hypothetical protein
MRLCVQVDAIPNDLAAVPRPFKDFIFEIDCSFNPPLQAYRCLVHLLALPVHLL